MEKELGICPAAQSTEHHGMNRGNNAGRICWAVAGTMCGAKIQGTHAEKMSSCMMCQVFLGVRQEEGPNFKMLMPGQKYSRAVR